MSNEFGDLLSRLFKEQGVDMKRGGVEVAAYIAERTRVLARSVGQAGFEEAVADEASNVALFAGIDLVHQAKASDARIMGAIEGALAIGVRAAAGA